MSAETPNISNAPLEDAVSSKDAPSPANADLLGASVVMHDFRDGFVSLLDAKSDHYLPADLEIIYSSSKEPIKVHRFIVSLSSSILERKALEAMAEGDKRPKKEAESEQGVKKDGEPKDDAKRGDSKGVKEKGKDDKGKKKEKDGKGKKKDKDKDEAKASASTSVNASVNANRDSFSDDVISIRVDLDPVSHAYIKDIVNFCYSGKLQITVEGSVPLFYLATQLEMPLLIEKLNEFFKENMNKQTAPLLLPWSLKLKVKEVTDGCITVFARHFAHLIDSFYDFKQLPLDQMVQLLQHPDLFVESEDILYDTIQTYLKDEKLADKSSLVVALFNNIRFVNLSIDRLELAQRNPFVPKELLNEALVARLASLEGYSKISAPTKTLKRRNSYGRVFEYMNKDFDTNGIIYFFATNGFRDPWKSPQERGGFVITMSSVEKGRVETICDLTPKEIWSSDIPSSWITVDLGAGRAIKANRYALRHGGNSKQDCLRNWVLKASNDNEEWVTLKRHKNDESFNSPFATSSWTLDPSEVIASESSTTASPKALTGPWRYFRIVQTGHNSSSHNFLSISSIEFFGELYLSKPK